MLDFLNQTQTTNATELLTGVITGVTVGIILFLINLFNTAISQKLENKNIDYNYILQNETLNEILNQTSYKYNERLSTIHHILKKYSNIEGEYRVKLNEKYTGAEYDIEAVSRFSQGIYIFKNNYSETDPMIIIDTNAIISVDNKLLNYLQELKKEIQIIEYNLKSRHYKNKISNILLVLDVVISTNAPRLKYGEKGYLKKCLEYNFLRKDVENTIYNNELFPHNQFLPKWIGEVAAVTTNGMIRLFNSELDVGDDFVLMSEQTSNEYEKELAHIEEYIQIFKIDGKNIPVYLCKIEELENLEIYNWYHLSVVHRSLIEMDSKSIFKLYNNKLMKIFIARYEGTYNSRNISI